MLYKRPLCQTGQLCYIKDPSVRRSSDISPSTKGRMVCMIIKCSTMNKKSINNLTGLKKRRKDLRNHGTRAEAVFWGYLKNKQLEGRRFRRQFSVGKCILDFYCPSENLNIELDGAPHFTEEGIEKDLRRDYFLKQQGITVLRFENKAVWNDVDGMLTEIKKHFKNIPPPLSPF